MEDFARPRDALSIVVLSKMAAVGVAASSGGVDGGDEALEDGALSRSMASGSKAD